MLVVTKGILKPLATRNVVAFSPGKAIQSIRAVFRYFLVLACRPGLPAITLSDVLKAAGAYRGCVVVMTEWF